MSPSEHPQEALLRIERTLGELQARLHAHATAESEPVLSQTPDIDARLDGLRALRDEVIETVTALHSDDDSLIEVDAGPFEGLAALEAFADELRALDEVTEVELRILLGRRALLAVHASGPVDFARALPHAGVSEDMGRRRLVIDV